MARDGVNTYLISALDSIKYTLEPVGFDRYLVSYEIPDSIYSETTRMLVQNTKDGYVILLPDEIIASNSTMIWKYAIPFFGMHERPEPSQTYQKVLQAAFEADYETVQNHISSHAPTSLARELISGVSKLQEKLGPVFSQIILARIGEDPDYIDLVDPSTIILYYSDDVMGIVWEEGSWKILPPNYLDKIYTDFELESF